MENRKNCPKCGQPFASQTGQDTCPKCLAEFVMEPSAVVGSGAQTQKSELMSDEPVLPNESFIGSYKIVSLLGRGGMGTVYKARQESLDRFVAVKVLPSKLSTDPEFLKRFNREAKALARLSHPNIVGVYDMGQSGDHFYFAMEFVEGVVLRDLIANRKLPSTEALKIVPQLCDALEYAHSEGIVHRDIKPENLLIDKKGRVKIADFGLARIVKGDSQIDHLTKTREVMGTFEYMAPEQRVKTKDVDHRADIYSMGVVFYEMLTGELPIGKFELPSHKVQIDVRLDDIVLKTLEQEPSRRYQRASQVGAAVSKIISEPTTGEAAAVDKPKDHKYSALAIMSLVLSVVPLFVTQILGFIFGIVAIRKINRANGALKGTGLAIAGLAFSVVVGFMLIFIAIPIVFPVFLLMESSGMTAYQDEKAVPEILQKLALAQEIYRRADTGGRNQNHYAERMVDLCSGPIHTILGAETNEINAADESAMADNVKPYKGYYYRILPWDWDFDKTPIYKKFIFAIAAYPANPADNRKTFVVDDRGVIYSKQMGHLKYPDIWASRQTQSDPGRYGINPTQDNWEVAGRVTISDEILKNAYQLMGAMVAESLTDADKKLWAQLKSRRITADIPAYQDRDATFKEGLKLVLGDIAFRFDAALASPSEDSNIPPFSFRDVTIDMALKTILSWFPPLMDSEWVSESTGPNSQRGYNAVTQNQQLTYYIRDGQVRIFLSQSKLPPFEDTSSWAITAADKKSIVSDMISQINDAIKRNETVRARKLHDALYNNTEELARRMSPEQKSDVDRMGELILQMEQKSLEDQKRLEEEQRRLAETKRLIAGLLDQAQALMQQKQYKEAIVQLKEILEIRDDARIKELIKQCEVELAKQK